MSWFPRSQPPCPSARRKPRRGSFRVESLERRTVLSTFTVTNLLDHGGGSLRRAILDANANPGADTIRFVRGVRGTIALESQLVITDDLTIRGPGAEALRISGGGATRVFAVVPAGMTANLFATPTPDQLAEAPQVSIAQVTIADGLATDALGFDPTDPATAAFAFGGGLFNVGGRVGLDRVDLVGNATRGALVAGGAVANEFGGTLTVSRSRFEGNAAEGLIVGVGGAITSDLGPTADGGTSGAPTVSIDRSTFLNNTARAQLGYIDGNPFTGLGGGGAIINIAGTMTIDRSDFEGNAAIGGAGVSAGGSTSGGPAFGGAINSGDISPFGAAESRLEVRRSTFAGNQAGAGAGLDAGLAGGVGAGGAIALLNGGDGQLVDNAFRDNRAVGGAGGAGAAGGIGAGGGVAALGGAMLDLGRNDFVGNSADGGAGDDASLGAPGLGGGLALTSVELTGWLPGSATATSDRDTFVGNRALGGMGGGVYNEGVLTLDRAVLSGNSATGDVGVTLAFGPVLVAVGGAAGGGLANFATLEVARSRFEGNLARAADDAVGSFAGNAFGGGLVSFTTDFGTATATVADSRFEGNLARAGDRGVGSFAAIAGGGALANDSVMEVLGSSFRDNVAEAGDGSTSPFHNGHALGGAISSGSLTPFALPGYAGGVMTIRRSTFAGNEAIGGDDNVITLPGIPTADTPNNGYGGGVLAYQGSIDVQDSTFRDNRAVGGHSAIDQGGSLGVGGGLFLFNFLSQTDSSGLRATVEGSQIVGNEAIGGGGLVGGDGLGGGIAFGTLGSLFAPRQVGQGTFSGNFVAFNWANGGRGDSGAGGGGVGGGMAMLDGVATISDSAILLNTAAGGRGVTGGNGLGGGNYNAAMAETTLLHSFVLANQAIGGRGVGGDGVGLGGGVYVADGGLFQLDLSSRRRTRRNRASTAGDDIYGDATLI